MRGVEDVTSKRRTIAEVLETDGSRVGIVGATKVRPCNPEDLLQLFCGTSLIQTTARYPIFIHHVQREQRLTAALTV